MAELSKIVLKCILVGDSLVGKTALMLRYVKNEFDEKLKTTINIDICEKEYGENLILRIWDTGGQERYGAITKSYYRDANALIFCYDISNPNSKITKFGDYRDEVMASAENCKFYICACKNDLFKGNSTLQTEMDPEEYAKQNGAKHFITSSKNGLRIDELFNTIAEDFLRDYKPKQVKPHDTINIASTLESKKGKKSVKCCRS